MLKSPGWLASKISGSLQSCCTQQLLRPLEGVVLCLEVGLVSRVVEVWCQGCDAVPGGRSGVAGGTCRLPIPNIGLTTVHVLALAFIPRRPQACNEADPPLHAARRELAKRKGGQQCKAHQT